MWLVSILDPLLFQNSSTKIQYKIYFKICGRSRRSRSCASSRVAAETALVYWPTTTHTQAARRDQSTARPLVAKRTSPPRGAGTVAEVLGVMEAAAARAALRGGREVVVV